MSDDHQKYIQETIAKFGCMPAPWVFLPDCHPFSIGWRMGSGEDYLMHYFDWMDDQKWSLEEKAAHFRNQDVPPAWLIWVYDSLYSMEENDYEFELDALIEKYRPELEALGFTGFDQFVSDFTSEHWR